MSRARPGHGLAGSPHAPTDLNHLSENTLGVLYRVFPHMGAFMDWGLGFPSRACSGGPEHARPHVAFLGRASESLGGSCGRLRRPSSEAARWAPNTLLGAPKSLRLPSLAGTISRVETGLGENLRSRRNLFEIKRFRRRRQGRSPQYDTLHGDDEQYQFQERVFVRREPLVQGSKKPRLRGLA